MHSSIRHQQATKDKFSRQKSTACRKLRCHDSSLDPGTSSARQEKKEHRSSMDNKNVTGVKVTYIETQFVTSDEAGFKDLVQRLTGRSAPLPPAPARQRPLPYRLDGGPLGTTRTAAGAAVPQGYHYPVTEVRPAAVNISRTPTSYLENMGLHEFIDIDDFSDLFYDVGANERSDRCYGSFPY